MAQGNIGIGAQSHRGTGAQRHRGKGAQVHSGTGAQWHMGTGAQRHRGTAQKHRGTGHRCTVAQWHRGTGAQWYSGTVAQQQQSGIQHQVFNEVERASTRVPPSIKHPFCPKINFNIPITTEPDTQLKQMQRYTVCLVSVPDMCSHNPDIHRCIRYTAVTGPVFMLRGRFFVGTVHDRD